jgi:glycerophosphoryl diester phosphodiesterase
MIKKNMNTIPIPNSNILQRNSHDIFKRPHKVFIEGHRGVNREFIENTIDSFKQAINYNLDSIELDVWLTKDKIPIVIHGGSKGNLRNKLVKSVTTNCFPKDFNSDIITKLKINGTDQTIPTLNEVLDLCKNKIFVNIELKDPNIKETFNRVIKLIERKKMINQIALNSYEPFYYEYVTKYNEIHKNKIEFGKNFKVSPLPFLIRYRFKEKNVCLNIYHKEIKKEIVDQAHLFGDAVMAWFKMTDEENEKIYKYLIDCGVDVISSNEPYKAKTFRDKYLKKK